MTDRSGAAASDRVSVGTPGAGRVGHRRLALRVCASVAAVVSIAAAIVLLPQFTGHRTSAPGTGALDSRVPEAGQPAPNFALPDPGGQVVRLSDLRGQVVLVNFWATWCVPCRDELPAIEQVYSEQRGQGFTVLAVNEQESRAAISGFAEKIGSLPPVLLDQDGSVMRQYLRKVPISGLPDSFVVDRQGIVRGLTYGPVTRETILNYIDSARQSSP